MSQPAIPGHTIVDRIGSGGFASVYRATNDVTSAEVAIKVLHEHTSNPDDVRRFTRERTTMSALTGHPHIVGVLDSGETETGQHFIVLEYVGGGSVRDRLARNGALHWSDSVAIGVQICSALDLAHRSGVLHRDVKPGNILLDENQAKLTDFGIARLVGQSQVTAAQSIIGTLAYTPPEVFHNKPFDGRGDIYQLGITLYEMILGRAPFTSAAADNKAMVIRRILENPAPPLAQFDVPQPLSDLLDEVLAKDPADRPQTAASLAERLNRVERQLGRTPTPVAIGGSAMSEVSTKSAEAPTAAVAPTVDSSLDEVNQQGSVYEGDAKSDGSEPESRWGAKRGEPRQPDTAPIEETPEPSPIAAREEIPVVNEGSSPAAPIIGTPKGDTTVVEQKPTPSTAVINSPGQREAAAASEPALGATPATPVSRAPVARDIPQQPSVPEPQAEPAPVPSAPEPKSGAKRWAWVGAVAILLVALTAGIIASQLIGGDDVDTAEVDEVDETPDDNAPGGEETPPDDTTPGETNPEDPPVDDREVAPISDPAFSAPAGSDGVVFGSAVNSFGLTMVGAAGDGEDVGSQAAQVWTLGDVGGDLIVTHRADFTVDPDASTAPQRLMDIGVIDGVQFLAVGEVPGSGGTDGVAWFGSRAESFVAATDASFTGTAEDSLRSATADDDGFLVAGRRSGDSGEVLGLWRVTADDNDWPNATWEVIDVGDGGPGVLNDVISAGDIAVAVGVDQIDGDDHGVIKIRRDGAWADLIAPVIDVEFWAVAILDDRIVAVGEASGDGGGQAVAVVSSAEGVAFRHQLPIRGGAGIARDVTTTASGSLIAVGDMRLDGETDGVIWELLPADDLIDDRWTTRASADLATPGFVELWSVNEYDGRLFAFGRTEDGDERPAGGWALNLE